MLENIAKANMIAKTNMIKPELCQHAFNGDVAQAKAALRQGADKDTIDHQGYTALQRCVVFARGSKVGPMMWLLLKVGADERLQGGVLEEVQIRKLPIAISIMKSVVVWRAKASFSFVSIAFLDVKMTLDKSKRSLRRKKKSKKNLYWTPKLDSSTRNKNTDILI